MNTLRRLHQGNRFASAMLLLLATASLLYGCASLLTTKPEAPTVSVTRVVPLNLSLSETRLNITLRLENSNGFDLPLQDLDFTAWFAGAKIADGRSTDPVTIPANGDALLDVAVVAGLSKLWDQFKTMFEEQQFDVNYAVTGTAKLANWPARIPFNVERKLDASGLD